MKADEIFVLSLVVLCFLVVVVINRTSKSRTPARPSEPDSATVLDEGSRAEGRASNRRRSRGERHG